MSATPHRRNPLRLIVNKEIQLRIFYQVASAVFFCVILTLVLLRTHLAPIWLGAVMISICIFVSLFWSREIAGPLYRIEKDIEAVLHGAVKEGRVHLRQGDNLQHLADLVNQLMERAQK